MAWMSVGVLTKQLVVHLWTLCQNAERFLVMWTVRKKVSAPWLRIRKRREEASLWQRKGGRPIPGGERCLTATKAAWTMTSLLTKWGVVETKEIGGFFLILFFIFYIMYSLIKVQETVWSASYDRNKTCKQSNDPLHPLMGKVNPL